MTPQYCTGTDPQPGTARTLNCSGLGGRLRPPTRPRGRYLPEVRARALAYHHGRAVPARPAPERVIAVIPEPRRPQELRRTAPTRNRNHVMDEADVPHADERPLRAAMKRAGWAMLHITREVGPGEYQLTYTGPGLGDRALTLRVQAKTSTLPEGVAVETRDPAGVDLLEALLALALHAGVKDLATLTAPVARRRTGRPCMAYLRGMALARGRGDHAPSARRRGPGRPLRHVPPARRAAEAAGRHGHRVTERPGPGNSGPGAVPRASRAYGRPGRRGRTPGFTAHYLSPSRLAVPQPAGPARSGREGSAEPRARTDG